MPVVDVHVHIYPDKIAEKAAASVGAFYGLAMDSATGSVGRLRELVAGSPITNCVVHSVATRPHHVESINTFIAATCAAEPRLTGFMTMHQDYPDPAAEMERARGLGLRGVKLHPDTQRVNMDDPRMLRILDVARQMGLPVIMHCGDYRYDYSHPRRMRRVLDELPGLVVDAAHFGGWSVQDFALEFLEDADCFLDMSSSMEFLGPRRTRELVRAYGPERILFGSDFPMWNPVSELERFRALGFSDDDWSQMTWHNAERFCGVTFGGRAWGC